MIAVHKRVDEKTEQKVRWLTKTKKQNAFSGMCIWKRSVMITKTCVNCEGSGKRPCPRCGGEKKFSNGEKCFHCQDDGSVKCDTCDGKGYRDEKSHTERVLRERTNRNNDNSVRRVDHGSSDYGSRKNW